MDQPDIEQRWRHDGWLHLPSFFTAEEVGRVNEEVARMWESRPRDVTVDDLDAGRRCRMSALAASDRRGADPRPERHPPEHGRPLLLPL
ncbi:MAG TPA: hypothetical protein VGF28_13655 [Thermoanaerobaculia bacterium]